MVICRILCSTLKDLVVAVVVTCLTLLPATVIGASLLLKVGLGAYAIGRHLSGGEGCAHVLFFVSTEPTPAESPKKVTATQGTQTDDSSSEYIDWSSQPTNESEILRYNISQREEQPPVLSLLDDPGEGTSSQREVYSREGAWNVFAGHSGDGGQTGILVAVDRVLREGEEGIIDPGFWLSCGELLEEPQDG